MPKRVFLSYATESRDFADRLAKEMSRKGASVFTDANTMAIGDRWSEVLRREIEKASALVVLLPSRAAANRNFVLFEVGAAKALGRRVLAVLPPGERLAEPASDFADVLLLDADQRPLESIVDTLLQAVPDEAEATTLEAAH